MRRNNLSFIIFFSLVFSAFFASCESEVEVPDGFIPSTRLFKVMNDTIVIDGLSADGSSTVTNTFSVTSSTNWFVETDAWGDLHATPDHDKGIVTITTSENETPKERKGTLTITTSDGLKKMIVLLQRPGKIELDITPASLKFGINGGSTDITINCNTAWTLSGGTSWCTANVLKGEAGTTTITFKAEATTEEERTVTFAVTPEGAPKSTPITVTQVAKNIALSVSQNLLTFNASAGQEKEFIVTSNMDWEAIADVDWIEVTPSKGGTTSTSTTVSVKCVKDNYTNSNRMATITILCYGLEQTILVTQLNTDVKFNVTLSELTTDGSEQTLTVASNTSWRVFCQSNWCHLNAEAESRQGDLWSGNGRVILTFDANTTGQTRTAYVTFEPTDHDPVTITVTQKAGTTNPGRQPGEDDNGRPNPSRKE